MKYIPLTKGKFAIVDDMDWKFLSTFKWQACPKKRKFYAVRMLPRNGQKPRPRIYMHAAVYGAVPFGFQIDHRNGNSLDNRRCNLRIATQGQQSRNSGLRKDNALGVKGVRVKPSGKYEARINGPNGKRIQLGTYAKINSAAQAYRRAAKRLYGDFARTK
jgi:HNH endonuclease